MRWGDVVSRGTTYSLAHLHPFEIDMNVAGRAIELRVVFGFHVFTDEKGNGAQLTHQNENRYFCPTRHNDSFQAPDFIHRRMAAAHSRAYFSRSKNQQFFVMDIDDYAMFLAIQKPSGTTNILKCRVVSAYTVQPWGRHGLPTRSKLHNMSYVLDMKEQGRPVPM